MYQVGEFIVHPGQGVCRVEDVSSGPDATYKLLPVGQRHAVHISFPVSNESRLRPILSAEEAREIIDQYPRMDVDDYADRNNSLEEQHFKQEIRNGSCRDTVRVAKTFSARIAEVEGRNKKAPVAYGRILKLARELEDASVGHGGFFVAALDLGDACREGLGHAHGVAA